jgi:hypothetical protein
VTWVASTKTWNDTSVDNCDVCGNLIINRYWSFTDDDGIVMRACRQDDEALAAWLKAQRKQPGYASFTSIRR